MSNSDTGEPWVDDPVDVFNGQNQDIQTITLMRLYDVGMAILAELNDDVHRQLLELHSTGAIAASAPAFNGVFVTNEINDEKSDGADS